ncbi:hypothetical protein QFC21_006790 [Naganishia friedmannii]|uniref:Uncharacterized protein n=1 Tax=Naganishia friedmannii TaxID=89922 RepID=A0ACC2UZQ1_9TREE|nr:hypothetical protein QFC21_006790 [Naganishia friedmannii]
MTSESESTAFSNLTSAKAESIVNAYSMVFPMSSPNLSDIVDPFFKWEAYFVPRRGIHGILDLHAQPMWEGLALLSSLDARVLRQHLKSIYGLCQHDISWA